MILIVVEVDYRLTIINKINLLQKNQNTFIECFTRDMKICDFNKLEFHKF